MKKDLPEVPVSLSMKRELARKGIHLLSLSVPLVYSYDLLSFPSIVKILAVVTLVFFTVDLLRLKTAYLGRPFFKLFGGLIRNHESQALTGSTFLLLSFTVSILVFTKPVAIAVMYYTVLGDGMASLVGKKWGRARFGRKSIEGSAACLLTCLAVGASVTGLSVPIVIAGACVATMVECLSRGIDDNLSIPLITGFVMVAWEWLSCSG